MVFHIEFRIGGYTDHYMTKYLDDFQRVLSNIVETYGAWSIKRIWTDNKLSWKLEK